MFVIIDVDFGKHGMVVTGEEVERAKDYIVDFYEKYIDTGYIDVLTVQITDYKVKSRNILYDPDASTAYISLLPPYDRREIARVLHSLGVEHILYSDKSTMMTIIYRLKDLFREYSEYTVKLLYYSATDGNIDRALVTFTSLFTSARILLELKEQDDVFTLAYVISKLRLYSRPINMKKILELYNKVTDTLDWIINKYEFPREKILRVSEHRAVDVLVRWNSGIAKTIS